MNPLKAIRIPIPYGHYPYRTKRVLSPEARVKAVASVAKGRALKGGV